MRTFDTLLSQYDYTLPAERIANSPVSPRDSAKLLVYDRKTRKMFHDVFRNLGKYLPKNTLLVLNETKVIPARLELTKPTGGTVRILYLATKGTYIEALADRPLKENSVITHAKNRRIAFAVQAKEEKHYILKPLFPIKTLHTILERYGTPPIPPYIKRTPLSKQKLAKEYQTIFAKHAGSIAAPTASLHFTKRLFAELKRHGITTGTVTLHVGLGTFAPLSEEHVKHGKLHGEWYEIPKRTMRAIARAKKNGHPVIAVGTTVVRTLESAAQTKKPKGTTDLFIREGYRFALVDGMITNFHVPRSSLMMLVAAMTGRKALLNIYETAKENGYRFFSFGDGMLIR